MKHDIRELGDVNVNAIEQYREVGNRFETMTAQREDIMKAEEAVLNRAEAYAVLGQNDKALADINIWTNSFSSSPFDENLSAFSGSL